jgi:hypothetical protein
LPISSIPALIKLTNSTNKSGAIAETGDNGEIVGINCKMAVSKKYTFANLLNCIKVATIKL